MTNRYRLARLAYPVDYRDAHFGELVATANELSNDRWSLRQAWSLLRHGLDSRCRLATSGSLQSVWRSGIRLGLMVLMTVNVLLTVAVGATAADSIVGTLPNIIEITLALAAVGFLAGNMRKSATVATALVAAFTPLVAMLVRPVLTPDPAIAIPLLAATIALCWWATDPATQAPSMARAGRVLATGIGAAVGLAAVVWVVSLDTDQALSVVLSLTAAALIAIIIGSFFEPRLAAAGAVYAGLAAAGRSTSVALFQPSSLVVATELLFLAVVTCAVVFAAVLVRRGTTRVSAL